MLFISWKASLKIWNGGQVPSHRSHSVKVWWELHLNFRAVFTTSREQQTNYLEGNCNSFSNSCQQQHFHTSKPLLLGMGQGQGWFHVPSTSPTFLKANILWILVSLHHGQCLVHRARVAIQQHNDTLSWTTDSCAAPSTSISQEPTWGCFPFENHKL